MWRKNKLKCFSKSQSENITFEDYKKLLDGGKYQQEWDNYVLWSTNHQINVQKLKQIPLSVFDDKRCYENKIKSTP